MFSYLGSVDDHPRQVHCHITETNARTHDIIRKSLHRSPLFSGTIEGTGPALLPVDRGQGGALRRARHAPDLHRARRAGHPRGVPERHLHQPALRRADRVREEHPRLRARARHASRLRDRIRLLRPARPAPVAGDAGGAGLVFRRPDQRHHGLRGGRRAGARGRAERGARDARRGRLDAAPGRGLHRRADRRPDHARHEGAVPDVHQPRRVPADRFARTTRTCA